MPVAGQGSVEAYRERLSQISDPVTAAPPEAEVLVRELVDRLGGLATVTRASLAALISDTPEFVPVLASVVGLSQERLKRQLKHHLGSEAWIARAQREPERIIGVLDDEFDLVAQVERALGREYTLADVLLARAGARAGAGGAVTAGRELENAVQAVIEKLGLPFEARTRFEGRGGERAPADFAIPAGGRATKIAIAVKGFDSTGSKLSAAYDEIERMAEVRMPTQHIFAIVDGIAWQSRGGDLRRLIALVREQRIDGMFTLTELATFEDALREAAVMSRLLDP